MDVVISPELTVCGIEELPDHRARKVTHVLSIVDPDLPDLAPHVRAVCIKDHKGGRAEPDFPVPGSGQIDHEAMFRTLFDAGFNGPMSVELLHGRERGGSPESVDERAAAAYRYLSGLLQRLAT